MCIVIFSLHINFFLNYPCCSSSCPYCFVLIKILICHTNCYSFHNSVFLWMYVEACVAYRWYFWEKKCIIFLQKVLIQFFANYLFKIVFYQTITLSRYGNKWFLSFFYWTLPTVNTTSLVVSSKKVTVSLDCIYFKNNFV